MDNNISFTAEQLNNMSEKDLSRLVMCTNDGQGDTNVWTVSACKSIFIKDCPESKNISNSDYIYMLLADTNANMTTFIWLENCKFKIVKFTKS